MATVLITGASGFIGRHLVRAVRMRGDEAVCLVRPCSDRRVLDTLDVRYAPGDITDAASLRSAVGGVDTVIHAAAMLKAPWRPQFVTANVGGTAALAAACAARLSPPALIVVSSLAAAGPSPDELPRDESMPPAPISIYGRVKLDAERAAAAVAAQLPVSLVRPPMVFGEGDRTSLMLFRNVRAGWHPLPGRRDHALSLIHAADLAELLCRVADAGERLPAHGDSADAPGRGLYYACADETPTLSGLGVAIAAAMELPPPRTLRVPGALLRLAAVAGELRGRLTDTPQLLSLDKARELRAGPWLCSAAKAKATLGFVPAPLASRLRQTVADQRRRGWL